MNVGMSGCNVTNFNLSLSLFPPLIVYVYIYTYIYIYIRACVQMALVLNRGLVDAHSNLGNLYKVG